MEIAINRAEAIRNGASHYHGKFCKRHHSTVRRLSRGECVKCRSEANTRHQQRVMSRDIDGWRARRRNQTAIKRPAINARSRKWIIANPVKRTESVKRYYQAHKDQHLAEARRRHLKYPERAAARVARRRARKLLALPKWLTADDFLLIADLYKQAKIRKCTVDHLIPLAGCSLCGAVGLEVPWNLRLLSKSENCSKGRRCDGCWSP